MDFSFNEVQEMVIAEARRFAQERLAPRAAALDEKGETNLDGLRELGRLGYLGLLLPVEFGGTSVGAVAYIGALIEISKADAGTATAVSVQNSMVNEALLKYGSEAQKKEFLPLLARGEYIGCFSLSEPEAGSDPGRLQTRAIPDGDGYILNGTKIFATSGDIADVLIVFAQTGTAKDSSGISAFIIKRDTPGFRTGRHERKMGLRSAGCTELLFNDCRVPAAALLGKRGQGLKIALGMLDNGRLGIAAQALGIAEAALEEAIGYAKQRVQFNKPIAEFQAIRFMLADMATEVEVAKSMLFRAAWMKESGRHPFSKEAAMAKLFASEMAHRVCHKALQIHGGYGYMKDYKIERLYRDQRVTEIYEGTSEIQRIVIARHLLD